MQRIGVRELNQNTSQILARVSGGESLEITDRGRPIARLVPVTEDQSTLARLVASGKAHHGHPVRSGEFWSGQA
ncbi:type II toxin-antitoxin system prevent-host-death family antitoxin [Kineosporia sp. NBRC 101677]|uniref:type II toxin-antitoxin system Phd/YefM family antitoxin n=1 Tax=Kineosporia sp. NBRC 101677 TaxID=3032197 RepID=UPI0025539551|nr:type II toxin-antitoxin system prevent-host-death family antitoxin [Kineosporia sp. NBRC 101677]